MEHWLSLLGLFFVALHNESRGGRLTQPLVVNSLTASPLAFPYKMQPAYPSAADWASTYYDVTDGGEPSS